MIPLIKSLGAVTGKTASTLRYLNFERDAPRGYRRSIYQSKWFSLDGTDRIKLKMIVAQYRRKYRIKISRTVANYNEAIKNDRQFYCYSRLFFIKSENFQTEMVEIKCDGYLKEAEAINKLLKFAEGEPTWR